MVRELERLKRNKDRREVREQNKMRAGGGSPAAVDFELDMGDEAAPSTPADSSGKTGKGRGNGPAKKKHVPGTTQRKCALCGMTGHIKTNKKWVFLLLLLLIEEHRTDRCTTGSAQWPTASSHPRASATARSDLSTGQRTEVVVREMRLHLSRPDSVELSQ